MNRLTSHISVLLSCSVLESDPEFGFEEAKRQLEGIQGSLHLFVFTSMSFSGITFVAFCLPAERPWLVDSYDQWLERLKVSLFFCSFSMN